MEAVTFQTVSKVFRDGSIALDRVSIHIEKGEFVFLTGRSGAGKSTFLKMLNCQERPTEGSVYVNGTALESLDERQLPEFRRRIGFMQSEFGLLPDRSLRDNVALAMKATEQFGLKAAKRVDRLLSITGISHRADFLPREVSMGEAARALLARALILNPDILIADEPTANLDPDASWDFMLLLEEINQLGITVIVACHDQELVSVMRKRVVTLSAGCLVADEKNAVYNVRAADAIEERRILHEREQQRSA